MTITKEMEESFHEDKAVQDMITESWLCVDCGVNTNPASMDGPSIRIAIALRGGDEEAVVDEIFYRALGTRGAEIYTVKDEVWRQAGMRAWSGCLCVGCLEQRLGRQLRRKDFSRHDAETWARLPCTERLHNRRTR
jgi:hypothetical protein